MGKIRVGFGFDVHRLVEGRELWLGGVRLDHFMGLLGHSDADVLIHAICDALLGAANMRDIGYHFPDTGEEFHNIDSGTDWHERLPCGKRRCHGLCRASEVETSYSRHASLSG